MFAFDGGRSLKLDSIYNKDINTYYSILQSYCSLPANVQIYNILFNNKSELTNFNNNLQAYYDQKCKEKNPRSAWYNCTKKI